ncbi:MAG: C39 family peptidase [Thermoanaerobaculia bacterium]
MRSPIRVVSFVVLVVMWISSVSAADSPKKHPDRVMLPLRAYQQTTSYTCGPASLLTLLHYYGRDGDEMKIANEAHCTADKGTSPGHMVEWLEGNGFDVTWGEHGSLEMLRDNLDQNIPTLVEWIDYGGHWVIVVGYDTKGTVSDRDDVIYFADPADGHDGDRDGLTSFNARRFNAMWFDAFLFEHPMFKVYITAVPHRGTKAGN